MRKDAVECRPLLQCTVAAVVDEHVEARHLTSEPSPEGWARLVAHEDAFGSAVVSVALVYASGGRDVDGKELCSRSKVVAPHPERTSRVDAHLSEVDVGAAESRQMLLVDAKVVAPLD